MNTKSNQKGFTIVELLIVIVVIAILAAITIVAYNGIQDRARASAASAALSGALKKIKVAQVTADSTAALTCAAFSAAIGATTTDCNPEVGSTDYQYTPDLAGTYCITATVGNKSYYVTGTNSTPAVNGCAGHGVGGTPTITNLVTNPSFENDLIGWGLNTPGFTGTGSSSHHTTGNSGARSYRYTVSTGGTTSTLGIFLVVNGINSTSLYTGQAYIRSNKAITYYMGAHLRNSSNTNIGAYLAGSAITTTPNTWSRVTLSIPPTTNMTNVVITLYSGANTLIAGDTIDFDSVMLTEGSTLYGYADGNSANWVWNNALNNSTSTGPPI